MRRFPLVLILFSIAATLAGQTSALRDDEVATAIQAARNPRWKSIFLEAKGPFLAPYTVLLQGPAARTMDLARVAYDAYKPFATKDVPVEIRERAITVAIIVHGDERGRWPPKNVVVVPAGVTSREAAILSKGGRAEQGPRTGVMLTARRP